MSAVDEARIREIVRDELASAGNGNTLNSGFKTYDSVDESVNGLPVSLDSRTPGLADGGESVAQVAADGQSGQVLGANDGERDGIWPLGRFAVEAAIADERVRQMRHEAHQRRIAELIADAGAKKLRDRTLATGHSPKVVEKQFSKFSISESACAVARWLRRCLHDASPSVECGAPTVGETAAPDDVLRASSGAAIPGGDR